MVLLVIHGLAGVIWIPAAQVLIHRDRRPRTIAERVCGSMRPVATWRFSSVPLVGDGLLRVFGAYNGIFINALIYVPLLIWLVRAPYGRPSRAPRRRRRASTALPMSGRPCRWSRENPVLLSMTILVGASAFFVGNAYQAQMPGFAWISATPTRISRTACLLAADAAGGLAAGLILESRGLLPPKGANGIHPGDDLVLCAVWIRPVEYLCGGHQPCCSLPDSSSWVSIQWRSRWCN